MTDQERQAIMALAIMAAFADDRNEAAERDEVKRVADSLSRDSDVNVAALYQDVLLKRATLDSAVTALASPETRRLAYELAVGVCNADGALSDGERTFLYALETRLGFDHAEAASARAFTAESEALAVAPLVDVPPIPDPAAPAAAAAPNHDRMILNYAILNGALELLPDSLATMAIIPLQMKMVYRIGKSTATNWIAATSRTSSRRPASAWPRNTSSRSARRLLGSLFGKEAFADGRPGGATKQVVSSGFSFATTYALGRLAVGYYAGGRTFSTEVLKDTYAGLLGEAKGLQQQYLPAIQEKARTVNVAQVCRRSGHRPRRPLTGPGVGKPSPAVMRELTGSIGHSRALPLQPRLWPSERWEEPSPPLGDDGHEPCRLPGVEQSSACLVPTEYASRISP